MKKDYFFMILFTFLCLGLLFLFNTKDAKAGYQGGSNCSSHWICGPPWYCGECIESCCWETRCCDSCDQQDPGIVWCRVGASGGLGICAFSCTPPCSCGAWTNGACGGGSCPSNQRLQTRSCTPSGCSSQSRCVADAACATPSCTVDLTPAIATFAEGSSQTFTANVTDIQNGTVASVDFSSTDTGIATVNPAQDTTSAYTTDVTGVVPGSVTIQADVIMGGSSVCSDTSSVDIIPAGPWWQVIDADIFSLGNLISEIPGACSGACSPIFDLDGLGGFPGLPIYTGSYDFSDGSGQGTASSTNWLAEATFNDTRTYNYSFFEKRIPSDATLNEITSPSIPGTDITSGGTVYDGYYWYHYDGDTYGDLVITSDVTIAADRKVILFVESADLTIQGNISIQADGQGFLLVIVGENASGGKGNITIDSSVGGTGDGVPEIEGLFLADNSFSTGTTGAGDDNQLHIRGSVASYGGISLQRDLTDDSQTPAELIEYAPELMLLFPDSLGLERMRWEEVAP